MKKLLCGILCASAGAALAVATDVTVATVDVIAVNSSLSNTVISIPGLDLSSGGDLAISNLVKTSNLTVGDRLLAFAGGAYECWTLDSNKKWIKPDKKFKITGSGADEVLTTDASMFTMSVGSGIWLSRQNSTSAIYIYAQHTNTLSTTVSAHATALLGNPGLIGARPTVSGCAAGDQIIVPADGLPKTYTYDSTGSNGEHWYSYSKLNKVWGLPTITAGTGFWYCSKGDAAVTVSW